MLYTVTFRQKGNPYGREIARKSVKASDHWDALHKAIAFKKYARLTWLEITVPCGQHPGSLQRIALDAVRANINKEVPMRCDRVDLEKRDA